MNGFRNFRLVAAAIAAACLLTGPGFAQSSEPYKPDGAVTFLSCCAPGGGIDLAINTTISGLTGGNIVDVPLRLAHKPGASGLVAAADMATTYKSADDILFVTSLSSLTASVMNKGKVHLDDLKPIGRLFQEYSVLYVPADSKFKTVQELADALKQDPTTIKIGGGSPGTPSSLSLARFVKAAGVKFQDLTYVILEGGTGRTSLLGGHIDVLSDGPEVLEFVQAGQLRALAVSSAERLPGRGADVPTYKESGFDAVQGSWRAVFGGPEMPADAHAFWVEALRKAVATPQFQEIAGKNGWDATFLDDRQLAEQLAKEAEELKVLLSDLGAT